MRLHTSERKSDSCWYGETVGAEAAADRRRIGSVRSQIKHHANETAHTPAQERGSALPSGGGRGGSARPYGLDIPDYQIRLHQSE